MSTPTRLPGQLRRAIDVYLAHAYAGPPPSAVRGKLETLRSLGDQELLASTLFERPTPATGGKLSLRLGNQFYPHMKLTLERSPDRSGYLFRADTHDRHCAPPPGSREHAAFMKLMDDNQQLAQAIETAWAAADLPTFKTYLRDDLARRAAGQ